MRESKPVGETVVQNGPCRELTYSAIGRRAIGQQNPCSSGIILLFKMFFVP